MLGFARLFPYASDDHGFVHKHIPFTNTTAEINAALLNDPTKTLELQAKRMHKQDFNLINIYILPDSSTPHNFRLQLKHLNSLSNTYILEDFNAHDHTWLTTHTPDDRGDDILQ